MNAFLLTELRAITGPRAVITSPEGFHSSDSDAQTNFRTMPQATLRICHRSFRSSRLRIQSAASLQPFYLPV
jgi:hypothetical protein